MTRARREREVARLMHQQPGATPEVFAMVLGIPVQQATAALLSLQARGLAEPTAGGWARRPPTMRVWTREPPSPSSDPKSKP